MEEDEKILELEKKIAELESDLAEIKKLKLSEVDEAVEPVATEQPAPEPIVIDSSSASSSSGGNSRSCSNRADCTRANSGRAC